MKFDVDYDETQGLGHAPPEQIVEDEYTKTRSRTRDLYPAAVFIQSNSLETIFNRADWIQIYQPLDPGEQAKVQFSHGSQGMYIYQNTFRVIGEITDRHTITLTTRNVRLVRVYLNDQMVDMSAPVKIIANGLTRYNAIPTQSIAEMLKDQTFIGRGWRYYTAVIDLDLTESPATRN